MTELGNWRGRLHVRTGSRYLLAGYPLVTLQTRDGEHWRIGTGAGLERCRNAFAGMLR